jgi:2-hydroxychromene-2-carboxylate isomerase
MKTYRFGWLLLLLIAAFSAIACNAIANIANRAQQVESAAQTAQALATAGQEIITQVQGNEIMQTAEASGLLETMQAAVTDLPGQSANIKATAETVLTQGAYGEAPSNIPLVYGEINEFFGSESMVTYTTPMALQEVVDFSANKCPTSAGRRVMTPAF